jgi:hypothetical protein
MSPLTVDEVLDVITDPRSVPDLRLYFGINVPQGSRFFAGSRFGFLGSGCRQAQDHDRFTAADLVAVQCLSVTVPVEVALDLLEGELGRETSELLAQVPADAVLGTGDARSLVDKGQAADKTWHLLRAQDDVGWVTAGKLLARKRPHLIPVWDHVVRCAFGRPDSAWLWLDDLLRAHDGAVPGRLRQLRDDAGLPPEVSVLRVLDVIVWMRHRDSHRKSHCPGL